MQVALHNNVKIYNLTAGKSLPEWLAEKKKNKAVASTQRIELIHDLEFPHFTRCLFRTANGTNLFAAGDYPPRLKCYDVNEMSMKYSFNADMSILGGVSLSPDFRKFALQGDGRQITVHHSAHIIDRVRVPHAQRGLAYHEHSCELLSPGSSAEIFRLSLDTGAFVESFKTASPAGVNHVDYMKNSGLIFAACENGTVECIDARSASPAGTLVVSAPSGTSLAFPSDIDSGQTVTHVSTDSTSGLHIAAGTSGGCVALYDIRSCRPLLVKDHMNSMPIVQTYFYQGGAIGKGDLSSLSSGAGSTSAKLVTADSRSVKIWSRSDGGNFTTIETPAKIYGFMFLRAEHNLTFPYETPDSGVLCICCDTPKVQVHFIPQLGVAPRWCSFLDSITEELEEKESTTVYDDYRFVGKEEFERLGLSADEINDGRVRPYMHGFFIENRLYRELEAIVDPSAFNRFAEEKKKERRQGKLDNRISKFKRVEPGAALAEPDTSDAVGTDAPAGALAGLNDPRFASKLKKDNFAVDPTKAEYDRLIKQVEERRQLATIRHRQYEDAQFRIVKDELPQDEDSEKGQSDDDEADLPAACRSKKPGKQQGAVNDPNNKKVTMYESKEGVNLGATDLQFHAQRKEEKLKKKSLGAQLEKKLHPHQHRKRERVRSD